VAVYDAGEDVDLWESIPKIQVGTTRVEHARDEITADLNIPFKLKIVPNQG